MEFTLLIFIMLPQFVKNYCVYIMVNIMVHLTDKIFQRGITLLRRLFLKKYPPNFRIDNEKFNKPSLS